MRVELAVRKSYAFTAPQEKILNLLTLNVAGITKINVVALSVFSLGEVDFVKIVVGTVDPNNPNRGGGGDMGQFTNEDQNKLFMEYLRILDIKYNISNVIQIFNVESIPGTPGIYRIYLSALNQQGIKILSMFTGEWALKEGETRVTRCEVVSAFIEVQERDLVKSVKILQSLDMTLPFNESQLDLNIYTILMK